MAEVPEFLVDSFMTRSAAFSMSIVLFKSSSPLDDPEAPAGKSAEKEPVDALGFMEQVEGKTLPADPQCVVRMSLAAAKALSIIIRKSIKDFEEAQGSPVVVPKDILARNKTTLTEW